MGKVGRPSGEVKTAKIEVKVEPNMKADFQRVVRQNGSNVSVTICEMIARYINEKGAN